MATTFKEYFKQGEALEKFVAEALTAAKIRFTHSEVGEDGDLTKQHMGDFELPDLGIWLECKNDLMFSKTGNLYLEIAEIRSEDSPKDARTIQPIGVLKHAAKAPTVVVHQIGEDDFMVYSVRQAVDAMLSGHKELRWNESKDWKAGREDKTNVGVLWRPSRNGKLMIVFRRCSEWDLVKTIRAAAVIEDMFPGYGPNAIASLAVKNGRKELWRDRGWSKYKILAH